ncbi:MAG TPA: sugar-binding transcriptional regulator, partial [Crenalkalicoccus sp.]|nr:sugar-binding transcriptional regulator [Crenalkalicoccus sp.]
MVPNGGNPSAEPAAEATLAARAAWLYHALGVTQAEVAARLGIAPAKAHRLIARAAREGLVRVYVEGPLAGCLEIEQRLAELFGLALVRVVPDLGEAGLPLATLGPAGASFLLDVFERGVHRLVGIGHGRTLAASVERLPRLAAPRPVRLVSILGGVTRCGGVGSFDVIHRLAEKTQAEAWLMPAPFYADDGAARAVLAAQRPVAEALALARDATLFVFGIGEAREGGFLHRSGIMTTAEMAALRRAGAVAEALGRFLDAAGQPVATPLHDRVLALDPAAMRGREAVAIAGGPGKAEAIRAVLAGGFATGLITDEPT